MAVTVASEGREKHMPPPGASGDSSRKLGTKIVQAWFVTVINPLIEGLELEEQYIAKGNPTWRHVPRRLEMIVPVEERIDPVYRPNLDHLLGEYSTIAAAAAEHDACASRLTAACAEVQRYLESGSALNDAYRHDASDEQLKALGVVRENLFGAYPREHHIAYLAELIINQTTTLPPYYFIQPLWNAKRERFLAILDQPDVRERYRPVSDASSQVLAAAGNLLHELVQLRSDLSHTYDVPFAPIEVS